MDQSKILYKITFILLGICALLGWNAVLNSFAFYTKKYNQDKDHPDLGESVSFWFPVPFLFANFIWGPFMPYFSTILSPKIRIIGGLILISILLVLLAVLALIANNISGFGISMLVTFLLGTVNSITQNTMIALATQLGGDLLNLYWVSTGISGFCMNFCQFVATLSFGATDDNELFNGTLFYYGLAIGINLVCIFMYLKLISEPEFQFQIQIDKESHEKLVDLDISTINNSNDNDDAISDDGNEQQQQQSTVKNVIRKIIMGFKTEGYVIPLLIWVLYVQTFMMFPGVTLKKLPFQFDILNQDGWGVLTIFTLFNFGDIIGKSLGGVKFTINQGVHMITVISRFAFYVIFLLIATEKESSFFQNDWVAFANTIFFAIFNGFCTTGLMILGSMKSQKPKELEIIGFINSFMLTFGISCGTFLALPFKNI